MPQFDILQYFTQLFWLIIFFNFLYFYSLLNLLPGIAGTYKTRNKKLNYVISNSINSKKEFNYFNIAGKHTIFKNYRIDYQNIIQK
jgi:hypothetical protein